MREITHQGKMMLAFQAQMAAVHKYKPIPIDLFNGNIRDKYIKELPEWCFGDDKSDALDHLFAESAYITDSQIPLYDREGLQICDGYHRIVIGDYGAFVEIPESMICKENIMCKKSQEYREKTKNTKTSSICGIPERIWLTVKYICRRKQSIMRIMSRACTI